MRKFNFYLDISVFSLYGTREKLRTILFKKWSYFILISIWFHMIRFTDGDGVTHTICYVADDKGYRVVGRSSTYTGTAVTSTAVSASAQASASAKAAADAEAAAKAQAAARAQAAAKAKAAAEAEAAAKARAEAEAAARAQAAAKAKAEAEAAARA